MQCLGMPFCLPISKQAKHSVFRGSPFVFPTWKQAKHSVFRSPLLSSLSQHRPNIQCLGIPFFFFPIPKQAKHTVFRNLLFSFSFSKQAQHSFFPISTQAKQCDTTKAREMCVYRLTEIILRNFPWCATWFLLLLNLPVYCRSFTRPYRSGVLSLHFTSCQRLCVRTYGEKKKKKRPFELTHHSKT